MHKKISKVNWWKKKLRRHWPIQRKRFTYQLALILYSRIHQTFSLNGDCKFADSWALSKNVQESVKDNKIKNIFFRAKNAELKDAWDRTRSENIRWWKDKRPIVIYLMNVIITETLNRESLSWVMECLLFAFMTWLLNEKLCLYNAFYLCTLRTKIKSEWKEHEIILQLKNFQELLNHFNASFYVNKLLSKI